MAETSQVVTPEVVKPLKGKYDGRRLNGNYDRKIKRGPKPLHIKYLSRNKAAHVLEKLDAIATWPQIYERAWQENDLATVIQTRRTVEDRIFGKPYVAVNPDERAKPSTVINDNRLQMAVQQLLPSGTAPKLPRKRVKRLNGASVETQVGPDLPEDVLSDSSGAK